MYNLDIPGQRQAFEDALVKVYTPRPVHQGPARQAYAGNAGRWTCMKCHRASSTYPEFRDHTCEVTSA